jgi:hypothetical protein
VVFLFAPASKAQSIVAASNERVAWIKGGEKKADIIPLPPNPLRMEVRLNGTGIPPVRFHKKEFLILSAAVYAASLADMHQTLQVRRYSWWYEKDLLAKPMVKLPAPAYYATDLALATGLNWLSWKMGHSRKWRKFAVIPQLLAIGGNTYGFKSNRYQNY